jgi:hypothetical protein
LSGVTGSYVTIEETLGDITIDDVSVESTSGDVDLTSTLGSIYAIGPATHIIAAGDSSLIAYLGVVGTIAGDPLAGYGPVNVDITGNLTIIAGGVGTALVNGSITPWAGTYWPVSSNIAGIVEGSTTYTGAYAGDPAANIVIIPADSSFPGALVFDPPGYVFFNTTEIWPHLPLPNSIDYLTGRAILPIQEILAISRMSTVNLPFNNNTIYGYHPVTPFDVSAFEGYTMSEDMYEFIEGQLQLKEGNFFSWFEEEMKKKKTQL